ncbi:MAG: transcriptional regulator [Pirellulales bacterium]
MARKAKAKASETSSTSEVSVPGRYNYEGLERTFHEKARLGIMTSLITHADGLTFVDLKELCSLSDGNLNRHIDVLREAGYIRVEKEGAGRAAKSTCFATSLGVKSFQTYLAELERVIQDAAKIAATSKRAGLGFSS